MLRGEKCRWINGIAVHIGEPTLMCELSRGLTEDSRHRQDEQLQQRVLFLIGQTEEAHLGHFGEVRDSSPCYLEGGRHALSGQHVHTAQGNAGKYKHVKCQVSSQLDNCYS